MSTLTHRGRVSLNMADLAEVIAKLRAGVDRVIYFVSDSAYLIITPSDIPIVEVFISGASDTLALPGGTLDAEGRER